MARYIDADALSIYFDALIKHAEMEGLYNMAHVYERCLQIVKDAPTADVAPRAEWISVDERLPKVDTDVLVVTAGGSFKVARCNIYKNGTLVLWATNDGAGERAITHWMPLPEPPDTEGGAE